MSIFSIVKSSVGEIKTLEVNSPYLINSQTSAQRLLGCGSDQDFMPGSQNMPLSLGTDILQFMSNANTDYSYFTDIIVFETGYKIMAKRDSRNSSRRDVILARPDGSTIQTIILGNNLDDFKRNYGMYILVFPDIDTIKAPVYNVSARHPVSFNYLNVPTDYTARPCMIRTFIKTTGYVPLFYQGFSYVATSVYTDFDLNGMSDSYFPYSNQVQYALFGDKDLNFESDTSKKQGGKGKYKYKTDNIDFPDLPQNNIFQTGLVSGYELSLSELNSFSSYLWSDNFITNIKKLMSDPMQAVISLSSVELPNLSTTEGNIIVGTLDSGIASHRINNQWYEFDCGSIDVKEFWGNCLDYSPHTQIDIYLPYIGTKQLSVSDIMNSTISLKYHVDIVTGVCMAYIKVTQPYGLNSLLYSYSGTISAELPLTANSKSELTRGILSNALGTVSNAVSFATGNVPAGVSAVGNVVSAGVQSIMYKSIDNVQRSGSASGSFGLLNSMKPYIIISRPVQSYAEGFNSLQGFPSNIKTKLSDISGFTVVSSIHLENIPATDSELTEIETLLKSGVIF